MEDGWDTRTERNGGNWNVAQVVLRALGKERSEEELLWFACLLRGSLGENRFSDGRVSPTPRSTALVDAELASESAKIAGWDKPDSRATQIKNLKVIKRLLADMK